MSFGVVRPELVDGSVDDQQDALADPQDLRLEMKVKNNVLWHAIYDQFKSVQALCKAHEELKNQASNVGDLLRFKVYPFKKKTGPGRKREGYYSDEYRHVCLVLEKVLRIPAEDLFPKHLYDHLVGVETEKAITVSSFTALPAALKKEVRALPAPVEKSPENKVDEMLLRERIAQVMQTLSYREREIIKLRFGLADGYSYT